MNVLKRSITRRNSLRDSINYFIPTMILIAPARLKAPLCRSITEFVRASETELLFAHSPRVYYFGALAGLDVGLKADAELHYARLMFHDVGLMPRYSSPHEKFEVDSANMAMAFLTDQNIAIADIHTVWTAIALHTTPDIPRHMHPVVALVTAGVEMDVLGLRYDKYPNDVRQAAVGAYPRSASIREDMIQAVDNGMTHRPDATFGTVNADVIADKEPHLQRGSFCNVIRGSAWSH